MYEKHGLFCPYLSPKREKETLFDNFGHDKEAVGLGWGVAEGVFVTQGGTDFIGAGDVDEGESVGGGFDAADVHLLKLLDVAEDAAKLSADLLLLFGRESEAREVGDVFDIEVHGHMSLFVEFAANKVFQLGEGLGGVVAVGVDSEFAAGTGGQHHQAHDALAVDLVAVFFDEDFATEPAGNFDEHGGGPGVDAEFVGNQKLSGHYQNSIRYFFGAHPVFLV